MVAIGKDKYQIIFDKAEVDAVTAQFYLDKSGRNTVSAKRRLLLGQTLRYRQRLSF
jgi:hypothetical protein